MASGTMWRSVTTVATAVYCSTCTATTPPSWPAVIGINCNCKTQLQSAQLQAHPAELAVSYGPQQVWDFTDDGWENIEERDRSVFGAMPTVEEVEEASSDLLNAFRLGYLTPPLPAPGSPIGEVTKVSTVTTVGELAGDEVTSDLSTPLLEPEPWIEPPPYEIASPEAPSSAVMEVFYEFEHNPEARDIVISLATDKGIWDAAMANEKIIEFRRKFSARTSEGTTSEGTANGATEEKVKVPRKNVTFFSRLYWITKQAFTNFIAGLQSFMEGLFNETADKKGPGMPVSDDGKSSFLDRMVTAYTRLAVFVLSFVTFKRSVVFKLD